MTPTPGPAPSLPIDRRGGATVPAEITEPMAALVSAAVGFVAGLAVFGWALWP